MDRLSPNSCADRESFPASRSTGERGRSPAAPGEVVTDGLDGLRSRLEEYASLGARFAKWRAVIRIGDLLPSTTCVEANAHALARYAALAQEAGLTPIIEPEVLMDGDHTHERCAEVTVAVLRIVYDQLSRHGVVLEASLLKPNMVPPGVECPVPATDAETAERTIAALRQVVPAAVPGLVFLSGGQSDRTATSRLNAMNRGEPQPWQLSFSFGRALQGPVLRAWAGDDRNLPAAQAALLHRARLNSAACTGSYRPALEDETS